eukprot:609750-Alexandrium_andersonii.AAC.1
MKRYKGQERTELHPSVLRLWAIHEATGGDATDTSPTCVVCGGDAQDATGCSLCRLYWHDQCVQLAANAVEDESVRRGVRGR